MLWEVTNRTRYVYTTWLTINEEVKEHINIVLKGDMYYSRSTCKYNNSCTNKDITMHIMTDTTTTTPDTDYWLLTQLPSSVPCSNSTNDELSLDRK